MRRTSMKTIEPSVNDQLRYAQTVRALENLDRESLLKVTTSLAHLALVVQPAAMRWAAFEAARNLSSCYGTPQKP